MSAPLENALHAALRKRYSELIVRAPLELCDAGPAVRTSHAQHFVGWSGLPEALDAARAGNLALVDEIELFWLNTWGPRPSIENIAYLIEDGVNPIDKVAFLAMEIHRHAGPRCETLVEWGAVIPCGRCWGHVKADPRCRVCGGRKHRSDGRDLVYTDIDGNPIEEANQW